MEKIIGLQFLYDLLIIHYLSANCHPDHYHHRNDGGDGGESDYDVWGESVYLFYFSLSQIH